MANRATEAVVTKTELSYAYLSTRVSNLVTLVNELKTDLNALREDFRAHVHGASYGAATTRINTSANTISGTETNAVVATGDAVAFV